MTGLNVVKMLAPLLETLRRKIQRQLWCGHGKSNRLEDVVFAGLFKEPSKSERHCATSAAMAMWVDWELVLNTNIHLVTPTPIDYHIPYTTSVSKALPLCHSLPCISPSS